MHFSSSGIACCGKVENNKLKFKWEEVLDLKLFARLDWRAKIKMQTKKYKSKSLNFSPEKQFAQEKQQINE